MPTNFDGYVIAKVTYCLSTVPDVAGAGPLPPKGLGAALDRRLLARRDANPSSLIRPRRSRVATSCAGGPRHAIDLERMRQRGHERGTHRYQQLVNGSPTAQTRQWERQLAAIDPMLCLEFWQLRQQAADALVTVDGTVLRPQDTSILARLSYARTADAVLAALPSDVYIVAVRL
ncbi:hypothetical protein [Phytohabitans aurantiacus]|uniref:DnaA N-terminal domain-containing protein n=1 Tax=Phytohabitans aurantiacus TaxID=3016789 RepID=A0ABQ5R1U2_9ACTN|nr:hypothetical protein [Phytohabitans aurantiacus]GLI00660.1 hypothetical protein Pa4123_59360 [Phytohabitans aurantiacus]